MGLPAAMGNVPSDPLWITEAEVTALGLFDRGLPLVIVNPAHVLGAGDPGRSSTVLVRRFLRREIPAYVDGTLNGDCADGFHGPPGERSQRRAPITIPFVPAMPGCVEETIV